LAALSSSLPFATALFAMDRMLHRRRPAYQNKEDASRRSSATFRLEPHAAVGFDLEHSHVVRVRFVDANEHDDPMNLSAYARVCFA
jgi:hypothetical protein